MPEAVQLRRVKGWTMPANTVPVARPSRWGNPYEVGAPGVKFWGMIWGEAGRYERRQLIQETELGPLTAEQAVFLYRQDLERNLRGWPDDEEDRIMIRDDIRAALQDLRGKNLACFCPLGEPCHRDVLLDLANRKVMLWEP